MWTIITKVVNKKSNKERFFKFDVFRKSNQQTSKITRKAFLTKLKKYS